MKDTQEKTTPVQTVAKREAAALIWHEELVWEDSGVPQTRVQQVT